MKSYFLKRAKIKRMKDHSGRQYNSHCQNEKLEHKETRYAGKVTIGKCDGNDCTQEIVHHGPCHIAENRRQSRDNLKINITDDFH